MLTGTFLTWVLCVAGCTTSNCVQAEMPAPVYDRYCASYNPEEISWEDAQLDFCDAEENSGQWFWTSIGPLMMVCRPDGSYISYSDVS
jgi:hypothetical protein